MEVEGIALFCEVLGFFFGAEYIGYRDAFCWKLYSINGVAFALIVKDSVASYGVSFQIMSFLNTLKGCLLLSLLDGSKSESVLVYLVMLTRDIIYLMH